MDVTVHDLTDLDQLNSESVKKCLRIRYNQNIIYTWAGPTLVALNPLQEIFQLYSKETILSFSHDNNNVKIPHIFAVAQRALQHLRWELCKTHQAIVVNGESGAGKTCSALHLLSYLSAMETNNNKDDHCQHINVLLCKSNPLLEALGNAQTLRNDNSSRFGKLIRLVYIGEGGGTQLVSAHIETYLLESTRVTRRAEGERNFHIFYQMLMGLPHAVKKEFFMEETCNWAIASPSDCSPNDKIRYEQTVEAFRQLDLQNTMKELWKMLAALLHLGNLNFEQDIDDDHAQWRVTTSTRHHLKACSQLLGIDCRELVHVITVRSLVAGSNTVLRPCTTFSECSTRRDTLLRILYRLAFDAVLKEINDKLHRPTASQRHKFLCILDLYGFESFEHGNSLEQLCINYANEILQHYFTVSYLKEQQTHLINEGFSIQDLDMNAKDKENVISLLDGPVSVFGILNEECYLNRGCDDSQVCVRITSTCINKCQGAKGVPPSPRTPRVNRAPVVEFTIQHYAGPVTYSTVSMLDKNRDQVPMELLNLLLDSNSLFIRHLVEQDSSRSLMSGTGSKSGRRHTVLAKFKSSLDNLMKILNSCDVHYVRCIRPSSGSTSAVQWDDGYVESQLKASGVIDTIKLSSFGYPIRMSHNEFCERYKCLLDRVRVSASVKEVCQLVAASYRVQKEMHVGKTQMYSTERGLQLAEEWRNQLRTNSARILQQWWRGYLQRKEAILTIQRWWRYELRNRAAAKLQRWWKRRLFVRQVKLHSKKLSKSIATVKRVLLRWALKKRGAKIRAQRRRRAIAIVNPVTRVVSSPERNSVNRIIFSPERSPTWPGKISPCKINSSKCSSPGLVLHLPRSSLFFKDGVISIRQPPSVHVHFTTKRTCLPYSHVIPKALMPCGLLDAL